MFSKLKNIKDAMRVCRILRKNGGIRICPEEQAQDFAGFVGYRAQLALYELHTDLKADMSWDDFVLLIRKSVVIREKIQRVVRDTIAHFNTEQLDFELPADALEYREDYPDDPLVKASRIYSDEEELSLIKLLFLQFEAEHFRRLAAVTPNYTWKAYMNDLSNDQELWGKFTRGFQHGLRQLDFKASWTGNASRDEILHLEFQKNEA